ncbi:hypothetical protein V2P20_03545 [Methylobacter sp. Wu1]|uniref:hypothetical protein n=1 Tax=Methylobacter sp. Wu1 TaxID=3119359 RepID=UPI002F95583A
METTSPVLIDRKQIAKLAGLPSSYKVNLAAALPALGMPQPKAKRNNAYLYDEAEILPRLEKTPLKDMPITSEHFIAEMGGLKAPLHVDSPRLDNRLACAFMRGHYATKWGRRTHDRRLLKARKSQPSRQIVHLKEMDNAREALRPGLTPASAPDGVTFASLAGNARQSYY